MYLRKPYLSQLTLNERTYNFHTIEFDGILFDKLLKNCYVIERETNQNIIFQIPTFYITTTQNNIQRSYAGFDKKFEYVILNTKPKQINVPKYLNDIEKSLNRILLTINESVYNQNTQTNITQYFVNEIVKLPTNTDFNNILNNKCKIYFSIFKQKNLPYIFTYLCPDMYKMIHHLYNAVDTKSTVDYTEWTNIHKIINDKHDKNLQEILYDEYKLESNDDTSFKIEIEREFINNWEKHLANIRIHYGCFLFTFDGTSLKPLSLFDNWIVNGIPQILPETLEQISKFIDDSLNEMLKKNGIIMKSNNFIKYLAYPQSYVINIEFINPFTNVSNMFPHVFANSIQLEQIINHMHYNIYDKIRFPININTKKIKQKSTKVSQKKTLQSGGGKITEILNNCKLVSYVIDTKKTIYSIVKNDKNYYYLELKINPEHDFIMKHLTKMSIIERNAKLKNIKLTIDDSYIKFEHVNDTIKINNGYTFTKKLEYDNKEIYLNTKNIYHQRMYEISIFNKLENIDEITKNYVKHLLGICPVSLVNISKDSFKTFYDNIYKSDKFVVKVNNVEFDIQNPYNNGVNSDHLANYYRNSLIFAFDDPKYKHVNFNSKFNSTNKDQLIDQEKSMFVGETYPVQYNINNDIFYNQTLIVNHKNTSSQTIVINTETKNIDQIKQSEQINDIFHFLCLKETNIDDETKLKHIFMKIYNNLESPNPSMNTKFLFDDNDEKKNYLNYLNNSKLFFHTYTAFATGIIHLHNRFGIINYKYVNAFDEGIFEYRSINLLFILLNINILNPDFFLTFLSKCYSKIYVLSHLTSTKTFQQSVIGGGNNKSQTLHLNDILDIEIKNINRNKIKLSDTDSINKNKIKFHTIVRPSIKFFKKYSNNAVPEDIFIDTLLTDKITQYKSINYITNSIDHFVRLCDITDIPCTRTLIENNDFNIDKINFDVYVLNPIKIKIGFAYNFVYQIFIHRLIKHVSQYGTKKIIIRYIPTLVIPFIFNSLVYLSSFSKKSKIIQHRSMMYIIYNDIQKFDYDVNCDDLIIKLKELTNKFTDIDFNNEIAQAQQHINSIGCSYVYNIDTPKNDAYNFEIPLFPVFPPTVQKNKFYFKLLSHIQKSIIDANYKSFDENEQLEKILNDIYFYEAYGIETSKTLKKIMSKNYKQLLYDFSSTRPFLKTRISIDAPLKKIIKIDENDYYYLNSIYDKLIYIKYEKYSEQKQYGIKTIYFLKNKLKQNRGTLKQHIMLLYKNNFKNIDIINDAYLKMYEILATIKIIKQKNNNTYNTFHFAEAPGGFVLATNTFLKVFNKNNNILHNWFANSYNPQGQTLKSKLKVGVGFDDGFGLMKRHPDNWLFGLDNTGDITSSANIINIKSKLKDIELDLITGDGGIGANENNTEEEQVYNLQKLDFAQMVLTANVATIKSNCVIKTFTNYISGYDSMKKSFGFYLSLVTMYIIMYKKVYLVKPSMSSEDSGEYYIVGKKFRGLDEDTQKELLNMLDNFKINTTFVDLQDDIVNQIIEFFTKVTDLNTKYVMKLNILAQCNDVNFRKIMHSYLDKTGCTYYLDSKKYIKKVIELNEEWLSENKFKLTNIVIDL